MISLSVGRWQPWSKVTLDPLDGRPLDRQLSLCALIVVLNVTVPYRHDTSVEFTSYEAGVTNSCRFSFAHWCNECGSFLWARDLVEISNI